MDTPNNTPNFKEVLTVLGIVAGLVSLGWQIVWQVTRNSEAYVQLTLSVATYDDASVAVLSTAENKGEVRKKIEYAALVVAPDLTTPQRVVSSLLACTSENTPLNIGAEPSSTVWAALPRVDAPVYCAEHLAIIPLPFLYKEQQFIGDEKISCRTLVDMQKVEHEAKEHETITAYAVRLLVLGAGGQVRSTQDLLPARSPALALPFHPEHGPESR